MNKLHPKATWYFRATVYRFFLSILFVIIFTGFFFITTNNQQASIVQSLSGSDLFRIMGATNNPTLTPISYIAILPYVLITLFFMLITGEIYAKFAYKNWSYEFGPKELRIEGGVIFKTYQSVPYIRIQNIDLKRGIFARIFGYSTVNIHTAGYSPESSRRYYNPEGHLPAVSIQEAEQIRNWVMNNIMSRKSGV